MTIKARVSSGEDSAPADVRLLAAKDVAAMLRVSVRTLYRLKDSGALPQPKQVAGSKISRWDHAQISNWVRDGMPSCRASNRCS